ncbi:hypothetical protein CN198_14040 [Sinorhizobium meliloti]|uniref:hypothetical protein n=1 Tax=Rhizobium meliloti TaxID=382 RepID=UPI000FD828EB|nr:hypothetical protein [Sinorhizobium meliloti]RVH69183.1 hypothetical protein CN198_14040 [Sinorhizobium meliloti]
MIKQIGITVAMAVAWGLALAAKEAFGLPDYAVWIAIIAVVGLIISFNVESRLQKLEERVVRNDYGGIIKLLEGERHAVDHQQPLSLREGGSSNWNITPAHEIVFEDFRWFAAVLNRHVSDPWAIEELKDTKVRGYDAFDACRRYTIWHNACEIGTLQVTVGGHGALRPETFADNRVARVDLQLRHLRFIRYTDARSLVSQVALLMGSFEDGDVARAKAAAAAADALGGYLWEAVRQPDLDPYFEYTGEGPYELLQHQVGHWKKHGVDPMEKWGGDRPKEWA